MPPMLISASLACGMILFLFVALYPFVVYPLSLALARFWTGRSPIASGVPASPRHFSVVFCAYNEEEVLPAKLANLASVVRESGPHVVEVLAYDDGSTDRTLEILRSHEPAIEVVTGGERSGKCTGINRLLERATGEIVVLTDANVLLTNELIEVFASVFCDPEVGVACSHLVYTNSETATASVGSSYWRLEEVIKQFETDTGSTMGADGAAYAIRRELFSPCPTGVADDFFISMSILARGYRVVSCPGAIAYERSVSRSEQEWRRKIRIGCHAWNSHRRLWPNLRRMGWWNQYKYFSHKVVRWFTALWLGLAAVCGSLAVGVQAGWLSGLTVAGGMVLGLLLLEGGGRLGLPVAGKAREVLLAFVGTFYGVLRSVRGERFETWAPASSARE